MKKRYNEGEQPLLYFYRDQRQHEVDLIEEMADGNIHAYEIKSGQTYRKDYFTQLNYLRSLLPDNVIRTQVIYDGEQENDQDNDGIINYRNI